MDSQERDKTDLICTESNEQRGGGIISYFAFESVQARNERTVRRLWITTIILIALLFATNALWVWKEMQYDYAEYEVTADDGSNANYIGGDMDGDINNGGTDKSTDPDEENRSERQKDACAGENG